MQEISKEVHEELYLTQKLRSRLSYPPIFILITVSLWYFREKIFDFPIWWGGAAALIVSVVLRIFLYEFKFESWKEGKLWARVMNALVFILLAFGWSYHFNVVYQIYGGDSVETSLTLVLVAGFLIGTTLSLNAHLESYFIFSTVITILCGLVYATDPRMNGMGIELYFVVYYFFNLFNVLSGHRNLRTSIENAVIVKKEKDRFSSLIEAVPGLVAFYDKDGVCRGCNRSTLELYPEIIGKKLGTIQPDSRWEKDLLEFLASDKERMIFEEHEVVGGKEIWTLLNVQRLQDGGIILVSVVTTELMEARKLIEDQKAKAHYSAKLASLGEMAAGIAHEVNNPLAIIQGSANVIATLVQEENIDRNLLLELTEKLTRTTQRISSIVRSLKNLSRSGDQDPLRPIDLKIMISQTLDICRQRMVHNEIELKLPEVNFSQSISGKEVQLSQVLLNLISNAIDAVKNSPDKWIQVSFGVTGNFLYLDVVDSGPGVPLEIRDKIMEPFFTTKEVNQGTGLGLSISKSIMQQQGGELLLLREAKNTTFRMLLPLIAPAS